LELVIHPENGKRASSGEIMRNANLTQGLFSGEMNIGN
jgi:hypothetical protein